MTSDDETFVRLLHAQKERARWDAVVQDLISRVAAGAGYKVREEPSDDCNTRPPVHEWWSTPDAARFYKLSPSRIASICRGHNLANDENGFAEHRGRKWSIWPARLRKFMRTVDR